MSWSGGDAQMEYDAEGELAGCEKEVARLEAENAEYRAKWVAAENQRTAAEAVVHALIAWRDDVTKPDDVHWGSVRAAMAEWERRGGTRVEPALEFEYTDRGFKHFPDVPSTHAGQQDGRVRVYESSNAEEPAIWLAIDTLDGRESSHAHLRLDDAATLGRQLTWLTANHYQRTP